jgi:hypothetical protein
MAKSLNFYKFQRGIQTFLTCGFVDLTHLSTKGKIFSRIYTIKCISQPNNERSQSSEPQFIRHMKGVQTFFTYCKLSPSSGFFLFFIL